MALALVQYYLSLNYFETEEFSQVSKQTKSSKNNRTLTRVSRKTQKAKEKRQVGGQKCQADILHSFQFRSGAIKQFSYKHS